MTATDKPELRPCPCCGGIVSDGMLSGEPYIVYHTDEFCTNRDIKQIWDVTLDYWTNAYCWREIDHPLQSGWSTMDDWLTLTQIARYWSVSEDEARQILIDHKKRPPHPSAA